MPEPAIPADIAKLGFEEALQQLEEIVRGLEAGKGRLDEAIKSYERGAFLKRHCEAKLREAQLRIDRIVVGADGSVKAQAAEL
jgi:exodeoxyribonuclease VII small subunit